jgi:1-acyl-sn-glycerol-3-phosphate acyltransferase
MVYWISLSLLYVFTRLYFRGTCQNKERFPKKGPAIAVVNHNSNMDVLAMSVVVRGRVRTMAKDSLFKVPLLGWWLRSVGMFPVIRDASDIEAFNNALDLLKNGNILFMAPEGTRKKVDGQSPRPKTGFIRLAQLVGCPIIPIAIYGTDKVLPPNAWFPIPSKIAVKVGEPVILPKLELTKEKKELVQKQAEDVMEIVYSMYRELCAAYDK